VTSRRHNGRDIVVVHSSDIHVDTHWTARQHGGDGTGGLRAVLDTARAVAADVVLLAGDIFDHNRLPRDVLARTAALLGSAAGTIVVLPGNHDPAVDDCGWHRGPFANHGHVHVLGVTRRPPLRLRELDLEIAGRPHTDYDDMVPLGPLRPRRTRWRIAMAHGHYMPVHDGAAYQPSWLIHDRHIAEVDADYVALGHWNRPARVGPRGTRAYYCGSPELAGTVNVVTLRVGGTVAVRCEPLRWSGRQPSVYQLADVNHYC
jgi:DNA repair exonuclease SbcCD nuclease subunit